MITLLALSLVQFFTYALAPIVILPLAIFILKLACSTTGYSSPPFSIRLGTVIIHLIIFSVTSSATTFILSEANVLRKLSPTNALVITTFPAFLISLLTLTVCLRYLLVVRYTQAAVPALAYMVIWYMLVIPIILYYLLPNT